MSATLASMWTKVPLPSCHPDLTCSPVRSHRRPRPRGQALEQGGAMVGPSAMSTFAKRRSQVQSDHDGCGASVELPAELPRRQWRRRERWHHHRVSGKATSARPSDTESPPVWSWRFLRLSRRLGQAGGQPHPRRDSCGLCPGGRPARACHKGGAPKDSKLSECPSLIQDAVFICSGHSAYLAELSHGQSPQTNNFLKSEFFKPKTAHQPRSFARLDLRGDG